jgi:hypothetical protein
METVLFVDRNLNDPFGAGFDGGQTRIVRDDAAVGTLGQPPSET